MPDNYDAERKIYFYRALAHTQDENFKLSRKLVCSKINSLVGTDDFYLDEGQDRITCAEVVDATAPQKVKLFAIRRENLPSLDHGNGQITDLNIREHQGLAEAVHVRLYPNNVVAAEFFYYGPRISRLQSFLNARCDQEVVLATLLRHDMIERALALRDIRLLRVKLHPSESNRQAASDYGLQGLIDTAKNFDSVVYADLTLRSERFDASFTDRVKSMLRRIAHRNPNELFGKLEVEGVDPTSNRVEEINLLSDDLVRVVQIPRQSARTRALDSDAAFAAIHHAYNQVKADLPQDAVAR